MKQTSPPLLFQKYTKRKLYSYVRLYYFLFMYFWNTKFYTTERCSIFSEPSLNVMYRVMALLIQVYLNWHNGDDTRLKVDAPKRFSYCRFQATMHVCSSSPIHTCPFYCWLAKAMEQGKFPETRESSVNSFATFFLDPNALSFSHEPATDPSSEPDASTPHTFIPLHYESSL